MSRFLRLARAVFSVFFLIVVGAATVNATPLDVAFHDDVTGFTWGQMSETANTSWLSFNAICTPVCSGEINGYDLTGWTWATVAQADQMWVDLLASPPALPFPGLAVFRFSNDWEPKLTAAMQPPF